jgi:Tfp pilus assembly protein PilE
MTKRVAGFTVIEMVFIIAVISFASCLFFIQKHNLEVVSNNETKKISINAMYYGLEEVFYPTNGYYPQSIDSNVLKSVDPALFTDPNGIKTDTAGSAYIYSPTNCTDNKCKSYTLKATLENENDFIKTSRN